MASSRNLGTHVTALYFELVRARQAGTLTSEKLRAGTTELSDALANALPRGAAIRIGGHRYENTNQSASGGLTRDGAALGREVFAAYVGKLRQAGDSELDGFLDDFPAVVQEFGDRMTKSASDLTDFAATLNSPADPGDELAI